jgi:4a-hydroxytetrahydrobiopterin dehydratase
MLSEKNCSACRGDSPPLSQQELAQVLTELPGWEVEAVAGINQLTQTYKFKNFIQAMAFTQAVGALAEEYGHHPALLTEWGKVKVSWWTHKIKGLHENDAIMAAKTGHLFHARFAEQ